MVKGFYNLTSGMLSQSRRLDVVANNMTNVATPGYKGETYTDTTFDEVVISLIGNKDKSNPQELGTESYILAPSQLYVDYTQGTVEETGMSFDFAIEGDGFFAIQTAGGVRYTRNGGFALDEEGYLCLPGQGRVLGTNGQPIYLPTDQIRADSAGNIYLQQNGALAGQIGVYTFADNNQLTIDPSGLFNGQGAVAGEGDLRWRALERANVDLVQEMTTMMSSQRAFQSAAQVLKIYDGVLNKIATDVGSV